MDNIKVPIAIGFSIACALVVALLHLNDQANWMSYFKRSQLIGKSCSYAIKDWAGSDEKTYALDKKFVPFEMPHRGKENPPRAYAGQALHTRCAFGKPPGKPSYVGLGRIIGDSTIFINGEVIYRFPSRTEVYFPLPDKFLDQSISLDILSRGTEKGNVGLATLIPPFITEKVSNLKLVQRWLSSIYSEQTMLRMGLSLSAVFFLGILWFLGRRYEDLSWVICFATTIAVMNLIRFSEQFNFSFYSFGHRLYSICYFGSIVFELLFAVSFLRIPNWSRKFSRYMSFFLPLLAVAVIVMPAAWFFKLRLLTITPAIFGVIVFSAIALTLWIKLRSPAEVHPLLLKRIRTISGLTGLSAVVLAVQAVLDESYGVYIDSTTQLGLLSLVGFISIQDLFFREKDFERERSLRAASEKSAISAKAIASTVQFIAHDVKRPLQIIEEQISEQSSELQTMLKDTQTLIQDLLMISPEDTVAMEPVSLQAVVNEAIESSGLNNLKTVNLRVEVSGRVVHSNAKLLKRAIVNILTNASEATNGVCEIHILEDEVDQHAKLQITNTNSEIPDEIIDHVFEANVTYGKSSGSGLGLTFCKMAIEKLGGKISVESMNMSTSFRIFLPIRQVAKAASSLEVKVCPQKICVIDDDVFVEDMWKHDDRFSVMEYFRSPDQFQDWAQSHQQELMGFDAVVIDFYFKNSFINGRAVATFLKDLGFKGLIVLSSHTHSDISEDALFDLTIAKGPKALKQYFSNS